MLFIRDDFFKNPYAVRNAALKQNYTSAEGGEWPGHRSMAHESISDVVVEEVRGVTRNPSLKLEKSSFQYVTKDYDEGVYHPDYNYYTCIIYLSLEPPPNSGTSLCFYGDIAEDAYKNGKEAESAWEKLESAKFNFYKDPKNFLNRYNYGRMRRRHNAHFNPVATIPNKFNRLILFDGNLYHRAHKFFGTSVEDARLTLTSFFK